MSRRNKFPKLPSSLVMLFCILLIVFVFVSRFFAGAPLTPLDESYEHLVHAQTISERPLISLYDYLLATLPLPYLLPPLLGLISLSLLGSFFKKNVRGYALLLFIITPLAFTLFVSHSPAALFFPISLLAFLTYQRGTRYDLLTIILAFLLPLIDPLAGIVVLLITSLYALHEGRGRIAGFLTLLNACFILFGLFMGFDPNFSVPGLFFGELGDPHGYSLFITLLALLSVLRKWRSIDTGQLFLLALLFGLSAFLPSLRPLVLIPLAFAAARELQDIANRKWALPFLKQATTLLLICLALFVCLSHARLLINAEPTPQVTELASLLRDEPRLGSVLVSPDIDGSAAYFSGRESVVFPYDDDLFSSVTIDASAPILREQKVRFMILSPLLQQKAWGRADKDFRFLMLHNEKFINVAMAGHYELWLVLPEFAR